MKGRIFAGLFLCSLFFVVGGDAQTDKIERPVWTLEFIKVRSENFGPAMGYLDDHWMRVRAEAKRQGAVLDYHRIQNAVLEIPGDSWAQGRRPKLHCIADGIQEPGCLHGKPTAAL